MTAPKKPSARKNPASAAVRKQGAPPALRALPASHPVPMPQAPRTRRDTRTFRQGTRIPGSNLVLTTSIRTASRRLPKGYGIDVPGSLSLWAYGETWDEAVYDFLTNLRDAFASLSAMQGNLGSAEQAELQWLRERIGQHH